MTTIVSGGCRSIPKKQNHYIFASLCGLNFQIHETQVVCIVTIVISRTFLGIFSFRKASLLI